MSQQYISYSSRSGSGGGGGGVSSLNGLTGGLSLLAGSNITITPFGFGITIATTGLANTALSNLAAVAINASLLPGTNNTLTLGDATHKWLSLDVTTINNNGVPVIGANIFSTYDSSSIISIDFNNRYLIDSSSVNSVTWENRMLLDVAGGPSIEWEARQLVDASGNSSMEWDARQLRNTAGDQTLNWESLFLKDPATVISLRWDSRLLIDTSGTSVADWENLILNTAAGDNAFDWGNVTLYGAGNIPSLEAIPRNLTNGVGNPTVDWSGGGDIVGPTAGVIDFINNKLTNLIDPTAAQDAATKNYVDLADAGFANTTLSNLGVTAINSSLIPSADLSINLGSALKRYSSAFVSNIKGDGSGIVAIDIALRTLKNGLGTVMFDWSGSKLDASTKQISNVVDPTLAQDAATKSYVDSAISGSGTVTSVALADSTALFNITGSPVTSSGTLTLSSFQSKTANFFFAAPDGASGAPTFRAIVAADVPTLNQNTTGTASNITASSNATLTTLSSLSLPGSQVTGNISGNAANVTGTVAVANGGTGATTAPAARVNLNIDQRTTVSNADYTILSTDRYVAQIGAMSAPRTWTLPAASSVNAGQTLYVSDESGTLSSANSIAVSRAGADTINGATSALLVTPFASAVYVSDGTSKWTYDVQGIPRGGTGATTQQSAINNLTGTQSSGKYLRSDGTNATLSSLDAADMTGTVAVANGGTSLATLTANNVILGNGTSAPLFVAPSTNGNVLQSNGTTWQSVVLGANSSVSASIGLTTNVTSGANTVVKYDTVLVDTNSAYSTGTGLFTVPSTGNYEITSTGQVTAATGPSFYVAVNGTNEGFLFTDSVANNVYSGSIVLPLTAGDTVGIFTDTAGFTVVGNSPAYTNTFSITLSGGVTTTQYSIQSISGNTTAVLGVTYLCDTSGAAFNVTLPSPQINKFVTIKDSTGSFNTNNLTVVRFAAEKIEGIAASKILQTNWGSFTLVSNGTDWFLV